MKTLLLVAGGVALALVALPLAAREISSDEAGRAAVAWVRRDATPLGASIASADAAEVCTLADTGGTPLFHVVRMVGGGVVVMSAESGVMPVVAFLSGATPAEDNPLWDILNADLAERMAHIGAVRDAGAATVGTNGTKGTKETRLRATVGAAADPFAAEEAAWAELLDETAKSSGMLKSASIPNASGLSDMRVAPLISTTWHQKGNAANYYTPPNGAGNSANYPCGCVALAGAQIASYWRFPTEQRLQVDRLCYVSGASQTYRTMGGTYDWQNMPNVFSALTAGQKQAIGKLCYDFGVSTQMDWGPDGSGTIEFLLGEAFRDVFGYASAVPYCYFDGDVLPDDLVEKAVLANLDAGCPVALGIAGHEVVADGYGYAAGTLYTHLNMGWGGVGNVWYNLPEVEVNEVSPSYVSTIFDSVVYNIFPTETGELLTGRVLDGNGAPVADAAVRATNGANVVRGVTNARGIYALRVTGGRQWAVTATSGGTSGSLSAYVALSASAIGERTPQGGSFGDGGKIGNSWGNDITLGVDVSSLSFEAALDAPSLVFTTGGDAEWFGQFDTTHDGTDAAQSGSVMSNQVSWLETTVTGPGAISFWWKVSSEEGWDWLEFFVDGLSKSRISGTAGSWTQVTVEISGGGIHTLRWRYVKDEAVSYGSDCGWVDQVVWTPAGESPLTGGYVAWAAENNLGAADAVTEGVPNLIRYVFDRPSGVCNPFVDIRIYKGEPYDGKPVITLLPFENTDGVTVRMLSTTDLADWSNAEMYIIPLDVSGGIIFNHDDDAPARFYKLMVE